MRCISCSVDREQCHYCGKISRQSDRSRSTKIHVLTCDLSELLTELMDVLVEQGIRLQVRSQSSVDGHNKSCQMLALRLTYEVRNRCYVAVTYVPTYCALRSVLRRCGTCYYRAAGIGTLEVVSARFASISLEKLHIHYLKQMWCLC